MEIGHSKMRSALYQKLVYQLKSLIIGIFQ
jgi:hypothetical protein